MVKQAKPAAKQQETTLETLLNSLHNVGLELYKERSGLPLNQAQRNLNDRCDYVEDASLKHYNGQVHSVNVLDDGLVLGIVESFQKSASPLDGRLYRPVFFNVFGEDIIKPGPEESFESLKKAQSDFWRRADEIEAEKVTLAGLASKIAELEKELELWRGVQALFP